MLNFMGLNIGVCVGVVMCEQALNPLPTLWVTVFFMKLLSLVFRSITIKAVQKLFVCILQPCKPLNRRCWMCNSGKILVSAVDALLQHYSLPLLKRFHPLFLGPSAWEDTNEHLLSSPQIRGLNTPVANWRVYSFKNTINSNIGDTNISTNVQKLSQLHCL